MLASAVGWLRRIGVIIPFAVVLMIGGAVLVAHAVWMHAKALLAQILLERAFTQTLATGQDVKPWSWADTWPVARVSVPRLGRDAIVLAGASGQALAFGPGHIESTPAAGEPGTAIYSGHRDTHFAFLGKVVIGDEVRVTRRDGRDVRFSRHRHLGGALGRLRHRSARGRPQPGAGHMLAARRHFLRTAALRGARADDRRVALSS